jgi:exonuclease SbcC
MDSMTFRSCALIMQDQYGLFLQADKEDRMSILGNILGLGIYGDMEQLAKVRAVEAGSEIRRRKTIIETLSEGIRDERLIAENLKASQHNAEQLAEARASLEKVRDEVRAEIAKRKDAADRAASLRSEIATIVDSQTAIFTNIESQNQIVREAETTLSFETSIREKAAKHPILLEEEKEIIQELAAVDAQIAECADAQAEHTQIVQEICTVGNELDSVNTRIRTFEGRLAVEDELRKAADEHNSILVQIAELDTKSQEYIALSDKVNEARSEYVAAQSKFIHSADGRKAKIESLEKKAAMLTSSGCPNPDTADCMFLKDAKEAANDLGPYREECTAWKTQETERIQGLKDLHSDLESQLTAIGYDPESHKALRHKASTLENKAKEYEQLSSIKEQLTLLCEQRKTLGVSASSLEERLAKVTEQAEKGKMLVAKRTDLAELKKAIAEDIANAAEWVEREKQIPIARERLSAANARIAELVSEQEKVSLNKTTKEQQLNELLEQVDTTQLDNKLREVGDTLSQYDIRATSHQKDIGRYTQRLEDIAKKKEEIARITEEIKEFAVCTAIFDTLKAAFSQDGIPHNIIRAILPTLSATANNILGAMTGGKMGIDFVTDKVLKSNSKKEVPTLDIVIEEYGKDTLPYLSKSGGEKVKASLSVILSLAETKSSQAGVQLGMLFIDEPPFLDADGVGAYCDALETIQRRYSSLKVMAITHDPTFKARFPQSIDIIKTENGSRVEAA